MDTSNTYTGYVPYIPRKFSEGLGFLIKEGIVKPGFSFLDLGAGEGNICIAAAQSGLHAYGIEINENLVKEGKRKLDYFKKIGHLQTDEHCDLTAGSYFTLEYLALRENGESIAKGFERGPFTFFKSEYSNEYIDDHFPEAQKKRIFYPIAANKDPYKELGVTLQNIDVFFSYTWGIELPAQLEMFSLYAKPETIFMNTTAARPKKDRELLQALNLRCRIISEHLHYIDPPTRISPFFDGLPLPGRLTLIQKRN